MASSIAGILGLVVATVALVISCTANNLSATANALAVDANSLADEALEPHELHESFTGCLFGVSGSVQVGGENHGQTTSGGSRYSVVTNTGRLPAMIVGVIGVFENADALLELKMSFVKLGGASSEPEHGALWLAPGEAAATRSDYELSDPHGELDYVLYLLADESADPREPKRSALAFMTPASVSRAYSALADSQEAVDHAACDLPGATPP